MVPLAYYCLLNLCPPLAPVPQPVLPQRSGGGGAAGGGGGLFVTFPGYKDPYKDEEAIIVEGEMIEADVQEAEALKAAAQVLRKVRELPTQPRPESVPVDALVDRLIQQAERRVDIEDAEARGRSERDVRTEAQLLAARLYAALQAVQAERERADWLRQVRELLASLQTSQQEAMQWKTRWESAQVPQTLPAVVPPLAPAPSTPIAVLPPPQQLLALGLEDPAIRRVWVNASVTAAVASAAAFSLFVLALATETPAPSAPPARPVARKRRRR